MQQLSSGFLTMNIEKEYSEVMTGTTYLWCAMSLMIIQYFDNVKLLAFYSD